MIPLLDDFAGRKPGVASSENSGAFLALGVFSIAMIDGVMSVENFAQVIIVHGWITGLVKLGDL